MRTKIKEVNGIDWFDGAVANCAWRGPRLRDVLEMAGVDQMSELKGEKGWKGHVECLSNTLPCEDTEVYGGSITLERAMMQDGDCILALEMNGTPLNVKHGAPIRAVFPGILGARSVKWLTHIKVQFHESDNHYQQRDYKVLPAAAVNKAAAEKYWDVTPSMNDMPINSIIGLPLSGSTVATDSDGTVEVRGYALPGGMDGPVMRVEVSSDGGDTWVNADLDFGGRESPGLDTMEGRRNVRWAWCLWKAKVKVAAGTSQHIVSRATDVKGNVQPKEGRWTLRGVGYNAWGEVEDLTVISNDEIPGIISIGNGLEAEKSA
jgi:sulfite oxidase